MVWSKLLRKREINQQGDRSYHLYQRYLHIIMQGINRNLVSRFTYMFLVTLRVLHVAP